MRYALVLTAALLWSGATAAQLTDRGPYAVKMELYVGAESVAPPEVTWTVDLRGHPTPLTWHVMTLRVLSGRVGYYDVIAALRPYPTAFTVHGDHALLERLRTAPAGQRLAVSGHLRLGPGARTLFLSSVEPLAPAVATPAPD